MRLYCETQEPCSETPPDWAGLHDTADRAAGSDFDLRDSQRAEIDAQRLATTCHPCRNGRGPRTQTRTDVPWESFLSVPLEDPPDEHGGLRRGILKEGDDGTGTPEMLLCPECLAPLRFIDE